MASITNVCAGKKAIPTSLSMLFAQSFALRASVPRKLMTRIEPVFEVKKKQSTPPVRRERERERESAPFTRKRQFCPEKGESRTLTCACAKHVPTSTSSHSIDGCLIAKVGHRREAGSRNGKCVGLDRCWRCNVRKDAKKRRLNSANVDSVSHSRFWNTKVFDATS